MGEKKQGITVLDLFCGAGGFSEGFQQAGFDVVAGIDNWEAACRTFRTNGLGESLRIDLLKTDVDKILLLKSDLEKDHGIIDGIIGSPPCTEFSYSKNGGKGNIDKGMLLVRRFLLFIVIFKPKFWVMENAPRLESVLNKECTGSKGHGWTIPYEKLDIPTNRFSELKLEGKSLSIPRGDFFLASDFGTHQSRKRFIAGDFPIKGMEEQKVKGIDTSLAGLLNTLKDGLEKSTDGFVKDPNYPCHKVRVKDVRDYYYDTSLHPLYWESIRHFKRRHIQYGQMHLPEKLGAPARTVLAAYFPVSREALVFETDQQVMYHGRQRRIFRQPKVREVACIQGFPLDFQLAANGIDDRYKLIGNAVPCQLSFAIAEAISSEIAQHLPEIQDKDFLERANLTLARQRKSCDGPIVTKPQEVVGEAVSVRKSNREFHAKNTKRIRRKFLSSRIEGNSCEVIFENINMHQGKVLGGASWKVCLQKLKGTPYHQVYLDENSVPQMIDSLNKSPNARSFKTLLKDLLDESTKGIPLLKPDWIEFPGWSNGIESYLPFITKRRARLPSITLFQKFFTEDMANIGNFVSPIDFFDGLDAIMLLVFSKKEFKNLQSSIIHVDTLKDTGQYAHRCAPWIISQLTHADVPLVTIMSCLLSVSVLNKMYENDDGATGEYSASLGAAQNVIDKWFS
jgi:site-specific DNA-cytosine methylase